MRDRQRVRASTRSALRDSEERYRDLVENSHELICTHDLDGAILSVNRAATILFGYEVDEIVQQKNIRDLLVPEVREYFDEYMERIRNEGATSGLMLVQTRTGERKVLEYYNWLRIEGGDRPIVRGIARDITEARRAQEASRTYSRRLIEAQEAERRRISLELHDQVGQILTAVKMNLHALRNNCSSPEIISSIEENLRAIDEAVEQVRDLSVDLRPLLLDDFGLVVALRWYMDRQAKNSGIAMEFVSLSLNEDARFPAELETACFRIVQEGVTNIIRHARASRISVRLERTGTELVLLVDDDGAGFDVGTVRNTGNGAATLGLRGMEERTRAVGGVLAIESTPGRGTQIRATFPLANEKGRLDESGSTMDWVRV